MTVQGQKVIGQVNRERQLFNAFGTYKLSTAKIVAQNMWKKIKYGWIFVTYDYIWHIYGYYQALCHVVQCTWPKRSDCIRHNSSTDIIRILKLGEGVDHYSYLINTSLQLQNVRGYDHKVTQGFSMQLKHYNVVTNNRILTWKLARIFVSGST